MDRFWVLVALADFVILGAVTAVPLAFDFRMVFGSHFFRPNALVILTTWGLLAGAVTVGALIERRIVRRI